MIIKILKTVYRNYRLKRRNHITIKMNSIVDFSSIIGHYTYIGYNCFVTAAKIGRYCSIANNVHIGMGEHNYKRVSSNTIFNEVYPKSHSLTSQAVVIDDDVWIGESAIILRGVTIGRGAVIGAGSVVTRDVPKYAIVVGVPAKVIKYRFDQDRMSIIEDSKWWEHELNEAKYIISIIEGFNSK
jgi:acetyltransferase-like isoleucine patch superfamily enzyme